MCHSSSDVLARPRRPRVRQALFASGRVVRSRPPESSAKPSPPGSSRRPRQSRPKLCWSPSRFVPRQSLCMESPLESSNKPRQSSGLRQSPPTSSPGSPAFSESSAVIRRRARARPRVPIVQSAAKVVSPAVVHRCRQTRPPSSLPELGTVPTRVPAKLFLGCPVLVKPQSSAVPARVVRRPRQSRPPSSC